MQWNPRSRGPGRYRLLDFLSQDDLGSVWAAEDPWRGQRVTVRLISRRLAEDPGFVDRLRMEMGPRLFQLSHPNVASVLDLSDEGREALYVVMEPMQGQTLAERLRARGPLPEAHARKIASCLADALRAAHRAGIAHGPVTPENVMLTVDGDVKLMDFGVVPASRVGPDAQGAPPGPRPGDPSADLESIDQLVVLMLSPSRPGEQQGATRSHHVQSSLEVAVFPPDLPDPSFRRRDLRRSAAARGGNGRSRAARARAPHARSVRMGRTLKGTALLTGGTVKGTALLTGVALKRTALRTGVALKRTALRTGVAIERTAIRTGGALERTALRTGAALTGTWIMAGRAFRWSGALPRRALRTAGTGMGRAGRAVMGHPRPVLAAVGVAAVAVGIVGLVSLNGGQATDGRPPGRDVGQQAAESPSPAPSSATGGVEVPNLLGRSAFQAQRALHQSGLEYGGVVPTTGVPGVVMATSPRAGDQVSRGTLITLFVGVRSDRLEGSSTPT